MGRVCKEKYRNRKSLLPIRRANFGFETYCINILPISHFCALRVKSFRDMSKRVQKGEDEWIAPGSKKDREARERIEKRKQLAKENEALQKEKEKERLKEEAEKNAFLVGVKVDRTLKYAEFDEIARRREAAEKKEKMVQQKLSLIVNLLRRNNKRRNSKGWLRLKRTKKESNKSKHNLRDSQQYKRYCRRYELKCNFPTW